MDTLTSAQVDLVVEQLASLDRERVDLSSPLYVASAMNTERARIERLAGNDAVALSLEQRAHLALLAARTITAWPYAAVDHPPTIKITEDLRAQVWREVRDNAEHQRAMARSRRGATGEWASAWAAQAVRYDERATALERALVLRKAEVA